jgi:hypothetical protein
MTLGIMTLGIIALGIMTLGIMTLGKTTLGIMTLSIMTLVLPLHNRGKYKELVLTSFYIKATLLGLTMPSILH